MREWGYSQKKAERIRVCARFVQEMNPSLDRMHCVQAGRALEEWRDSFPRSLEKYAEWWQYAM